MYDELVGIKHSLSLMESGINKCVTKLDSIAYHQEIAEACQRQLAVAATLLSQIEYYKNKNNLPFALHGLEGVLAGISAQAAKKIVSSS